GPLITTGEGSVEVDHLGAPTRRCVGLRDAFAVGRARLVEDLEAPGPEGGQRLDHGFVELTRALAAADDEQPEGRRRRAPRRLRGEGVEERAAQRRTGRLDRRAAG